MSDTKTNTKPLHGTTTKIIEEITAAIPKLTKRIDRIDNYASPEAVDLRSRRKMLIEAKETITQGGFVSVGLIGDICYCISAT